MIFKNLNPFNGIKEKTDEIVFNTENYIKNRDKQTIGCNTVSVMINGEKVELNQEDYNKLKVQNSIIKQKLKEEIKDASNEYKKNIKKEQIKIM